MTIDSLVLLKLNSGELVIGEQVTCTEVFRTIRNARVLVHQATGQNVVQIGMSGQNFLWGSQTLIKEDNIDAWVTSNHLDRGLIDAWVQATTSIAMPSQLQKIPSGPGNKGGH